MKFNLNIETLKKVIIAYVAAAKKAELPALAALKLEAKNGTLSVTGYDTTLGVVATTTEVTVEDEGVAVVKADIFKEICNKISYGNVKIEATDENINLITETDLFEVPLIDKRTFPYLPDKTDNPTIVEVNLDEFLFAINNVAFAVENDITRKRVYGVSLIVENGEMTLVGIDGHKLAVRKIPCRSTQPLEFRLELDKLKRAIKAMPTEGVAKIFVYDRHLEVGFEDVTVYLRLVDGCVSNYNEYIPKDVTTVVKVNRDDLIEGCSKCNIFNVDRIVSPMRCEISKGESNMHLSLNTTNGRCEANVPVIVTGNSLTIGLDNTFLAAALNNSKIKDSDNDEVIINFSGPLSPAVIRVENSEEVTNLIVPMRLSK